MDQYITKAKNFQDMALTRKRKNLLNTLEKMKDQVLKESEKTKKMQEFFYIHCEKILNDDIDKWENNKEFFSKMFELHEQKIKEKK